MRSHPRREGILLQVLEFFRCWMIWFLFEPEVGERLAIAALMLVPRKAKQAMRSKLNTKRSLASAFFNSQFKVHFHLREALFPAVQAKYPQYRQPSSAHRLLDAVL
jgi:hypothetical protein